jgi:hypothetical protein
VGVTTAEEATEATLRALASVHARHEADVADRMVEGLRIARPDEDEGRINEACDWLAETDVRSENAFVRILLREPLLEAFAQPDANRRRRDVNRLVSAERARLAEGAGVVLLQPALQILEAARAA